MTNSNSKITFKCGAIMKNRFMLAPLTNQQSHEDGRLSDDEFHWLNMRAKGQFGLVMTCASHVQEIGKGFPGQLGVFDDALNDGHLKLTSKIKSHGSLIVIQLHHAGMRSPRNLIKGSPVCASNNEENNARGLSLEEVKQLRDDFVNAAVRAKKCGYDGVEIHGAHGYILTQFLSPEINKRTDQYGGSLLNRSRLLFEIVEAVRETCGAHFLLGVRLSPERYGMDIEEIKTISQRLIDSDYIDFLDISLWDSFKMPHDEKYQTKTLLEHFNTLDFKHVKWTVAGKISNANDVQSILDSKVDFVTIGTSAILHHNFPELVINNPNFTPTEIPVTKEQLKKEGLSNTFINYLNRWPDFIKD